MMSTPGVDVAEQESILVHGVANLVVILQQPLELESAENKLPFNNYPSTGGVDSGKRARTHDKCCPGVNNFSHFYLVPPSLVPFLIFP